MHSRILGSLDRQRRALELLEQLLGEEFSLLAKRDATSVTSIEFSIQELLRQLGAERTSLRRIYAGLRQGAKVLADVADLLGEADRQRGLALVAAIGTVEKRCAKLASGNYQMALGLYDVTKDCLDRLQSHLIPKKPVYGSRGRLGQAVPAPGRVDGRC